MPNSTGWRRQHNLSINYETEHLALAYNSVVRAARLSVGDTEEEQEEDNTEEEDAEHTDAILVSLHNLATAEDIVKEMISDLGASFVLASLGYYKQGLSTLRNVLESAVLLSYTLAAGEVADWVSGGYGIDKFTQMVKRLAEQGIISKEIESQDPILGLSLYGNPFPQSKDERRTLRQARLRHR
jgi:hypothetical protein